MENCSKANEKKVYNALLNESIAIMLVYNGEYWKLLKHFDGYLF